MGMRTGMEKGIREKKRGRRRGEWKRREKMGREIEGREEGTLIIGGEREDER